MEQKTIKALFVNGGPRKNKNTAQMLESAMTVFKEEDKRKYLDEHFDTDLKNAYDLGKRLVGKCQEG